MAATITLWTGVALTVLGLGGLVLSIFRVARARRVAGGDDDALRAALLRILPLNLGALFVSALGLMMIVVGLFLG
ncbi:hypothetical protein BCF33_0472 [Hasllibacter halocynthiae]|uniref:Uncharacterized protein n=1 Tax=Hasllibacter halocynthiae TaxID=595589 RepID=A0A2T0X7E7_9RHOB|nr:hypothetical protein [Hasllibacter halocynthiae]PRY94870.1 hypothetical protein BCF33_0472 [Hasllibacter halocynthiae]